MDISVEDLIPATIYACTQATVVPSALAFKSDTVYGLSLEPSPVSPGTSPLPIYHKEPVHHYMN